MARILVEPRGDYIAPFLSLPSLSPTFHFALPKKGARQSLKVASQIANYEEKLLIETREISKHLWSETSYDYC